MISGLFLPKITMWIGFINAGARIVYVIMYTRSGSDARKVGNIAGFGPLYLLGLVAFGYAIKAAIDA